ncbi:MAG: 4-hydroxy-tetrahydrodipicolinate reductase [Deltaproteobacteria bacterium]|nr:4-hydroxy-tetrahydrodipicolinate reductase [Deltaproteobacteria bacterium]
MKLAIYGAGGRMGKVIARLVAQADDLSIVGAVDAASHPHLGRDVGELAGVGPLGVELSADLGSALLGAEMVIDFSVAAVFDEMLRGAIKAGLPVVSGTTMLSDASQALLARAAETIAVLWAPNMSLGVQVLARLVEQAVAALPGYDVELCETHHGRKIDAPSGTATMLVDRAVAARRDLQDRVHGRQGEVGQRRPTEVGVHALRGGGVVGDHSLHLLGPFDRLEITHRAMSRDLFAEGALRAARFLLGRSPGRYDLADLLDAS